jgi:hypothetical protein
MPIGQLKGNTIKPKADGLVGTETVQTAGVTASTLAMGEISVENAQPEASVTVDIPALKVSKVATRRSPDKKSETITYVVNYKLPTMVDTEKKNKKDLALKITEPTSPVSEQSPRQNVKDSDDVKALLEGPGTYFHVAQPSPDISLSAPELGKQAPKRKKREPQQVTYNVTYDVITRKPESKKAKGKKDSSGKKFKVETVEVAAPVAEALELQLEELMVNVDRPPVLIVQMPEPVEPAVLIPIPEITTTLVVDEPEEESKEMASRIDASVSSDLNLEPVVYVVDENELINIEDDSSNIDSDMKKIQDSLAELDRELNYQMNLPEIDYTGSYEQRFGVGRPEETTLVLDAPEMFANFGDNALPLPSIPVSDVSVSTPSDVEISAVRTIEVTPVVVPAIDVEGDYANANFDVEVAITDAPNITPVELLEARPVVTPLPAVDTTESPRSITYIVNYDEIVRKAADKPKS